VLVKYGCFEFSVNGDYNGASQGSAGDAEDATNWFDTQRRLVAMLQRAAAACTQFLSERQRRKYFYSSNHNSILVVARSRSSGFRRRIRDREVAGSSLPPVVTVQPHTENDARRSLTSIFFMDAGERV